MILGLAANAGEVKPTVEKAVNEFAARGFRSLGVARAEGEGAWQFLGVLPLFDPPRDEAKATIATAHEMGVKVKMVTGDALAIARETAGKLGRGGRGEKKERKSGGTQGQESGTRKKREKQEGRRRAGERARKKRGSGVRGRGGGRQGREGGGIHEGKTHTAPRARGGGGWRAGGVGAGGVPGVGGARGGIGGRRAAG